ncbi:hypothetical protein TRFO_10237 [Tritrichomonas foetus]|uniref:Uncharacterized protein n=1 Tax=Tritrichomonas foetus TaxID=1144522 RepID=A0A1J4JEG8_9EUKA|nr:hypothetical protein TRFO_10237 [Tritrichomonas foetus]|eukprot:OHS96051.1 hypothetical protein TRFO_10237 [Tritrichomonas foetus]
MKVTVLQRELAEKTRILEQTSAILADSQKQYQKLLAEFKKLKTQSDTKYLSANSQNNNETDFLRETIIKGEKQNGFNQPIQQLQDFEYTVNRLSDQMNGLRRQNNQYAEDAKKWNDFAFEMFNRMKFLAPSCEYSFPENDSEAQRFILLDLMNKIGYFQQEKKDELSIYQNKYKAAKNKLQKFQERSDQLLKKLKLHENENYDHSNKTRQQNINHNHFNSNELRNQIYSKKGIFI